MSVLALLLTVQAAPQAQRTPCRADTNLVGTWRVVEFAGEQRPESYAAHKHVTPTHFAVIHWDPAAASTASLVHSGTYALGDGTYTETILYGLGEAYKKVAGQSFRMQARCWISGDEWHIEADIPGFPSINERWVRVTPSR